jgi:hypothetical protein
VNIAVACNLLLPPQYMDHIIVNKQTAEDAEGMMYLFEEEMRVRRRSGIHDVVN